MGPLAPEIVGDGFNLIIAFLLGVLFGLALEQAGFSSTKKLVGLFYGYDFTVLKVFFTAGVTAMTGVLLLSHLGYLDMRFVFVNPTFLWPAIVGGAIMGLGFVTGGFCPGTSLCAAAIGKIDAWAFIGGSFIGIFAFTEGYPYLENLYLGGNMGSPTMDQVLNISKETFALALAAIAVAAFYITGIIEDKVNGLESKYPPRKALKYAAMAILPFMLVSFVFFTPDRNQFLFEQARKDLDKNEPAPVYPVDRLASDLVYKGTQINLIDVRSEEEYKQFSIPGSVNIPLDSMVNKEFRQVFTQPYKINIFYGSDVQQSKLAYLLAERLGKSENYAMTVSPSEFRKMFYEQEIPSLTASKNERDLFRYRLKMGIQLKELEERLKNLKTPVKKQVKKVQGGCS